MSQFLEYGNMLAQICQLLAVDSSKFPQNEQITITDTSNEGVFLVNYFLNLCLKQNRPVCFVGLCQSFHHYNIVAQKLGTNLLSARDQNKNLHFIEGLKLLGGCVDSFDLETPQSKSNVFVELVNGNSTSLHELIIQSLQELILKNVTDRANLGPSPAAAPVVIIDDLSVLEAAGVPSQTLNTFISKLNSSILHSKDKGSLIILTNVNKEDDDHQATASFMSSLSTLKIEVSPLSTGYCKDVHGQIQVNFQDSISAPRKPTTKHTQFKLTDKSVELFASGMSTAVL